jgi:hypothetical protein
MDDLTFVIESASEDSVCCFFVLRTCNNIYRTEKTPIHYPQGDDIQNG